MKRHFAVKPPYDTTAVAACGRGRALTDNVYHVDCGLCQKRDSFIMAKEEADRAKHERFMAQEPRTYGEPWKDGLIECVECGGNLFRVGDRSCYGHYDNFHCANCGKIASRLTETGMSF